MDSVKPQLPKAYEVTIYHLAELDRVIVDSAAHGFVKVVTLPGKDKTLGVTIVGEHAEAD